MNPFQTKLRPVMHRTSIAGNEPVIGGALRHPLLLIEDELLDAKRADCHNTGGGGGDPQPAAGPAEGIRAGGDDLLPGFIASGDHPRALLL